MLLFLGALYDAGCAASTLKVYTAAISACHNGDPDGPRGKHPLWTRFLKGVQRLRPPRVQPFPSWDLYIVLEALTKAPFELLELIDLKHLFLKTAFLLAITSTKRVSESFPPRFC